MCEWLSHGEWCDVTLLCGGQSFKAHRAVLASVSKFLRNILLSCPADEAPALIVLPDFDLEAMSSVFYYIYNGEVVVPKHKLALFLDIIQALQIYIEWQYLPLVKDTVEEAKLNFNTNCDMSKLKRNIFTLGLEGETSQRFYNIKRGPDMQILVLQYSRNETDFEDNAVSRQNGSELRKARLGDLKSSYGDRQRNSFLRDLFIETYPQNGNVNGLTEGVLAISNEYYHSPASVLSTNANGEYLRNQGTLSTLSTKNTTLNKAATFHFGQQMQFSTNFDNKRSLQPLKSLIDTGRGQSFYDNRNAIDYLNDQISLLPQEVTETRSSISGISSPLLVFPQYILDAMTHYNITSDSKYVSSNNFHKIYENGKRIVDKSASSKIIFNQVLENPWNPRKPSNYKPFRRKPEVLNMQSNLLEEKSVVENDSNNNIQAATSSTIATENLVERVSYVSLEPSNLVLSTSIGSDCLKCIHCNQVFTSEDALAIHMRRHSTNARYTCGECGKTFSQLRNFKYHMSIHRGTKEFAATCTVCGKYFNDRGYLSSHMKIHRNRKEYKCSLCPKSFNQRVAYNMHVRIHTGIKPHVCEQCGKAFSRKMLLKQHQRTHSGERPYACPHCDKRFADRSNMTLHLRLHTGVKPFSCTLCPKSFTKKHHLKSHLNFHTGSKPYSCPRCKLAFTQSSNMRTHYKKCNAPDHSSGNDRQSNII